MKFKFFPIALLALHALSGCTTYQIPVDSFKQQFAAVDSAALIMVKTRGPAGDVAEYPANPIRQIQCVDKHGNRAVLTNSPSIETRITTADGKRTIFYFDRVYLENDTLYGQRSRFVGLPKGIAVSEIVKVEVQDGGKNFRYVD